jgi:hypothetical protein
MATPPIAEADIAIVQGATFDQVLFYETGQPLTRFNLTGYTAKMQIRSKPESKAVIIELVASNPAQLGDRLTLNYLGNNGAIRLFITAADTAAITGYEKGVYDLNITSGNVTTRILQGNVIFFKGVTK